MSADAIYVNGVVWAGGGPPAETGAPTALAVERGRITVLGDDRTVRALAGPGCPMVDLGGRRVVPGLIDGHIHAVRAGATWDRELHWDGMPDVRAALAGVRDAVADAEPGEWIRAVGGWHHTQFADRRPPTREELDAAAPGHPVYVQALYEYAVLNSAALQASGLDTLAGDPPGGHVERDPVGRPTGRITGLGAFTRCLDAMPRRTPEQERHGIAAMVADLHATGLTGVVDPGGFGMAPSRYDGLFALWRDGGLTLRMRLFLSAVDAGHEQEQLGRWLQHTHTRFGDDVLRILGIGEVVHFGCHDFEGLEPFGITEQARTEFEHISRETARRGWPMHVHAVLDTSIDAILDSWERVHRDHPLTDLRFSLAHADRISVANVARLRALGAGVVLDDHLALKAATAERAWGEQVLRRAPAVGDMLAGGLPLAASTDATRASSFSPWLSLWWLVAGRSVDGITRRGPEHLMSRTQALTAYTAGSAWLSFEERDRGHLRPGARADLAVLDRDYFTVEPDEVPGLRSDLTVVGGAVVHSTGEVADATPARPAGAASSPVITHS